MIYTQGVALSGRLRFGALSGTRPAYADGIAQLVEPYLSGARPWFTDSDGGANYAGIVWADEMFDATGDSRYRDLLLEIAALFMDGEIGSPPLRATPTTAPRICSSRARFWAGHTRSPATSPT